MKAPIPESARVELHALLAQVQGLQQELLLLLGNSPMLRSWFTPAEFAREVRRTPAVVRAWCRNKRLNARKRAVGRGKTLDWEIASDELVRFRNHGLLPLETRYAATHRKRTG